MGVNLAKPQLWKDDIVRSVDLYNQWFLRFAPKTYREERDHATGDVEAMLQRTDFFRKLTAAELEACPAILPALRMCTAPPIARDRLAGLAGVPKSLVNSMENHGRLPSQLPQSARQSNIRKIVKMILRLVDIDIFPWLADGRVPGEQEAYRAATVVADRLCGANADPIVRNAQERRQLGKIKKWLERRGYKDRTSRVVLADMKPGEFAFRINVPALKEDKDSVNVPVDAVVMPRAAGQGELPLMIEAKSAGDFTNTNKRRKEEATKIG